MASGNTAVLIRKKLNRRFYKPSFTHWKPHDVDFSRHISFRVFRSNKLMILLKSTIDKMYKDQEKTKEKK
jgi:hypothetical protein